MGTFIDRLKLYMDLRDMGGGWLDATRDGEWTVHVDDGDSLHVRIELWKRDRTVLDGTGYVSRSLRLLFDEVSDSVDDVRLTARLLKINMR